MANFYTEVPELKFQLNNPMMERICELKERGYQDKDKFDYAPQDYADAMDSYDKVLEITGEITGEIINPNAEGVDEEGPHCANGRVEYASGTKQNLDASIKMAPSWQAFAHRPQPVQRSLSISMIRLIMGVILRFA